MREIRLVPPELGLIVATRGMLGVGIGLLLAGKLKRQRRVTVGYVLTAIGALSTIPLAIRVFRRQRTTNGRAQSGMTEPAFPS